VLGERVMSSHKRWSAMLLICFVSFVGCTEDNSPPEGIERFWDKDLANISRKAGDAKLSIGIGKYTKCLISDLFSKDKNKNLGGSQSSSMNNIEELLGQPSFNLQCEFFKELDERGSVLVDQIKKERKEPSSFYSFQALEFTEDLSEGSVYQSYDIGLFLEKELCQEFERRWRDMGLPTTDCMENKANNTADQFDSFVAAFPEQTPSEKRTKEILIERVRQLRQE